MKHYISLYVRYLLFWLLFFEFSRIFFLAYNYAFTATIPFSVVLQTFVSGFQHDISMVGYAAACASLFIIISIFCRNQRATKGMFTVFTLVLLIPFSILTVSDAELYRNWGYRTECSVLQYLTMPKEALGSIPLWHLCALLIAVCGIIALFYFLYKKYIVSCISSLPSINRGYAGVWLAVIALCIIPIRGGLGVATLRSGSVYFSSLPFANHAAINDHWHFLYSFVYSKKEVADVFMEQNECDSICDSLLHSEKRSPIRLITAERPNVLLFILESFTAPQIGCLGGVEGITPNIDSIAKHGVLFANCYGNGTKSEMGIASILSGYPAQPTTAIVKYTEKAEKLPYLSRIFDSLGYHLSLYHGGDIHFANLNSYFYNGKFEKCITIDDFDKNDGNAKWGAYDHVVFNRLLNDLRSETEPFFSVCYTLSSHEPFDVPMKSSWYASTYYSRFLNSLYYSDKCIGDFMKAARNEPWWNNTVVIFISDHGSRITETAEIVSTVDKFHIPMIWTGGAVAKDTVISDFVAQCDLPMMLCNQLNVNSEQFYFSKDILRGDNSFAFYAFNNGFGYLRGDQFFSWDNESSEIIDRTEQLDDTTLAQGKAYLQKVTTDFCNK